MHGLKQQRQAHNWSQQQLAHHSGTDRRRISDWELGKRRPDEEETRRLIKALGRKGEEFPPADCALQPRDYQRLTRSRRGALQTDSGRSWADLESRCPDWIAQKSKTQKIPLWLKKQLRADVGLEVGSYVLLWEFGFTGCLASIALLDFDAHPLATEALRGLARAEKACFSLARDEREVFLWPQVSLCCGPAVQRVDFLAAVFHRKQPLWVAIEIDGSSHHGRERWDLDKESRLHIRTLRFTSRDILSGQFPHQLWNQLIQLTT